MVDSLKLLFHFFAGFSKSRSRLEAENAVLRQELRVALRRAPACLRLGPANRLIFTWLYRICPRALDALVIVKPATVVRWHRAGFRASWHWKSRKSGGRPTAPGSPWQNGHVQRLIGSVRRECLGHIIVLGENHLYPILKTYAEYYNDDRPHGALGKDAPNHRPMQRQGPTMAWPIMGGLHYFFDRM